MLEAGHHAPAPHHRAEAEPAVRRPGAPVPGHHSPGVPRLNKPDADLELEPGQGEGGGGGRGVGGRGEHNQHVGARTNHLKRKIFARYFAQHTPTLTSGTRPPRHILMSGGEAPCVVSGPPGPSYTVKWSPRVSHSAPRPRLVSVCPYFSVLGPSSHTRPPSGWLTETRA